MVLKSLLKNAGRMDFFMPQIKYECRIILEKFKNDEILLNVPTGKILFKKISE